MGGMLFTGALGVVSGFGVDSVVDFTPRRIIESVSIPAPVQEQSVAIAIFVLLTGLTHPPVLSVGPSNDPN